MSKSWLARSGIKKEPGPADSSDNSIVDGAPIQTEGQAEAEAEVKNDKATPVVGAERGIPSVNQSSFRSRALPFSIAAIVLAVIALVWLIPSPKGPEQHAKDDPKATKDQRFDENRPSAILSPTTPPLPPVPPQQVSLAPTQPMPLKTPNEPIKVIPAIDPKAAPKAASAPGQRVLTPLEMRQQSKALIVGTDEKATATPAAGTAVPVGMNTGYVQAAAQMPPGGFGGGAGSAGGAGAGANGGNRDQLGDALRPTLISGTTAGKLADRTFMMTQGKLLDCSLDVAISSVVPGMTKCTLTRGIYGDDRKVVLLERGTELTGQYQGGLQQGQSRLFILWVRATTPSGVIINLSSPGTDSLGRGGVDGYIDTHFWERFGAALFLSVIDDGLQLLTAKAQNNGGGNGGTTVVLPQNTTQTTKSAAAIAVENDIHIPPTLTKNQGEHVSVFVARDLDFRTVYAVKAVDVGQ
jgi:type IV secretion system protein VirB10